MSSDNYNCVHSTSQDYSGGEGTVQGRRLAQKAEDCNVMQQ